MDGVKKEEDNKNKPQTFLEYRSGNGKLIDEHLILSLENEIVDNNLNVKFDDIKGNEDAKNTIEEACI